MPGRRNDEVRRVLGGGKKVVLWVGRMSPEKGLDFLALTYNRLRRQRDDVQLVLVGDGPYREQLEQLLPGASFLGYRTGDELATIYASADVFVFPGAGRDVRPGAARGGGVRPAGGGHGRHRRRRERGSRRDRLVVPPGDASGFVAALERLLDDEPPAGAWGSPPASGRCSAAGRRPSATCARSTGRCRSDEPRRGSRTAAEAARAGPGRRRSPSSSSPTTTTRSSAPATCAGSSTPGRRTTLLWATAGGLAPARRRIAEGARALAALGLAGRRPSIWPARPARRGARRDDRPRGAATCSSRCRARAEGRVYVPAYEGGHPDHDAVNLAATLAAAAAAGVRVVEFPLYRRGRFGLPYNRPCAAMQQPHEHVSPCCRSRTTTTSPRGATSRGPTRASSRRRFCRCSRWHAGRGGGGPNRPAPSPPTSTLGRPIRGRLLYELYTPWRFADWGAAAARSSWAECRLGATPGGERLGPGDEPHAVADASHGALGDGRRRARRRRAARRG